MRSYLDRISHEVVCECVAITMTAREKTSCDIDSLSSLSIFINMNAGHWLLAVLMQSGCDPRPQNNDGVFLSSSQKVLSVFWQTSK